MLCELTRVLRRLLASRGKLRWLLRSLRLPELRRLRCRLLRWLLTRCPWLVLLGRGSILRRL